MPLTPTNLNLTTSNSSQPPHFSSLIGKSLPLDKHYNVVVEEVLAEGGFGVIFLVKNSNDKVKYALKRVVVNEESDYESVVGEVGVMSLLSPKTIHILPSLTHLVVSYPSSSTYELCNLMPLCKQNLLQIASSRMQKHSSFTNEELLQIFTNVCSGLQYLHTCSPPIIHRDIKIENILLLEENYLLSDFGSATTRVWDPTSDSIQLITEDLDKHTTLLYRSPEMVDLYGGRGKIGVASDVWALGVCGFKLMTFKDPFESILAIQNRNLTWSQGVKTKFSENTVNLVESCLSESQIARPGVVELLKICGNGMGGDWTSLHTCVQRISDNIKSMKEEESKKANNVAAANANVVMETTVTPRQRPKRGGGGNSGSGGSITVDGPIPVLAAPPKSPKPVSPSPNNLGGGLIDNSGGGGTRFFSPPSSTTPQQTISPTTLQQPQSAQQQTTTPSPPASAQQQQPPQQQQPQQQPPSHSWNPFDEDYMGGTATTHSSSTTGTSQFCDNDSIQQKPTTENANNQDQNNVAAAAGEDEDDPFAKAPFDYFKYQPIIQGGVGATASAADHQNYLQQQLQQSSQPFYYYASNNPFLNYPEELIPQSPQLQLPPQQHSSNSINNPMMTSSATSAELNMMTGRISSGVCNLSFDDEYCNNNLHSNLSSTGGGGERCTSNNSNVNQLVSSNIHNHLSGSTTLRKE